MRASLSEHRVILDQIDYYNGRTVEAEGVITETDIRRDKAKYTIQAEFISLSEGGIRQSRLPINGDILISLNKYPQYDYGDRVRVSGKAGSAR